MKIPWLVGSVVALVLTGCGDDHPQGAPAAPAAAKKPAAAVAAAPAPTPAAAATYIYTYNPTGKRDPFRSPSADAVLQNARQVACDDPLCQYDLDQLTLVAVVTGDSNPVAMVEDSAGHGFLIHRNTRMGKQGGRVTQILRDSITITEMWTGPDGKVTANPVSIALKADKENDRATDLLSNKTFVP